MSVKIIGTGSFVPEKVLTNHDLEKMVDTSHEWILERTGIHERRIASSDEKNSDMAIAAALRALENAGCDKNDIDLLIIATVTPDMFFPSTACVVQEKMGMKNAVALDVSAACSGFVYAFDIANQYLMSGRFKRALLIGSEKMSFLTDWSDRNTCILFGDGAGAVVVEYDEKRKNLINTEIGSGLDAVEYLKVPAGGSAKPIQQPQDINNEKFIKMDGKEVYKKAVNMMCVLCERILENSNKTAQDLKLVIPHQANIRIIDSMRKKLKLPTEKVFVNIHRYGNSSAASIPVALDEAFQEGLIHDGDLILLVGFGAGFTWGSVLLEW